MKSNSRRVLKHQTLVTPRTAERLLTSLANAKLPDEIGPEAIVRLRTQTERYWPDLWGWADESAEHGAERASGILRIVRHLLRQFWTSPDPHARDWFIYRIRELLYLHQIQPQTQDGRERLNIADTPDEARSAASWLNITIRNLLNEPPLRTPFEDSLFYLQQIAEKVRFCPNPKCDAPYFILSKKGQKYCGSKECVNYGQRKAKKKWWNDFKANKDRRTQ